MLEWRAAGVSEDLQRLQGWRYEEFGHEALARVEGRVAFAVEDGKLKLTRTE